MAEPRTLDNPNDISIREQQKQTRLALAGTRRANEVQFEREFGEPFTFRFRQVRNGSFAGLWELAVLKPNGKFDELITDADALPEVLEMIGNIFANKGY